MSEKEFKEFVKAPSVTVSISRKIPDGNYGNVEAQVTLSSGTNQGLKAEGSKRAKVEELFDEVSSCLDERLAEEFLKQAKMHEMEDAVDDAVRMLRAGKSDQALELMEKYVSGGESE